MPPNNIPLVTSCLKALLNQKKMAFGEGERYKVKASKKNLRGRLKRRKKPTGLRPDGVQQTWSTMRKITGFERKGGPVLDGDHDLADGMNAFFSSFNITAHFFSSL